MEAYKVPWYCSRLRCLSVVNTASLMTCEARKARRTMTCTNENAKSVKLGVKWMRRTRRKTQERELFSKLLNGSRVELLKHLSLTSFIVQWKWKTWTMFFRAISNWKWVEVQAPIMRLLQNKVLNLIGRTLKFQSCVHLRKMYLFKKLKRFKRVSFSKLENKIDIFCMWKI